MISGILAAAASGLGLNAKRASAAADNIVNVSTTGYKTSSVAASTLVTRQTTQSLYSAGGVQGFTIQANDVQGLIAASPNSTDLAISGQGYFTVSRTANGGETLYSRDGSFKADASGNLVNASGHHLQGIPLDAQGSDAGGLGPVNLYASSGTAAATTSIQLSANIPANAAVGDTFTVDAQATDSLGNPVNVQVQFENLGGGEVRITVPGATEGSASGPAYDVITRFGSDGQISGFDTNSDGTADAASAPSINIAGTGGAADLSISLDLAGSTRFSGAFTLNSLQTDGAAFGTYTGVEFSTDGTVTAHFDNGQTRPIARIEVTTFSNPGGLEALSGNLYQATDASGAGIAQPGGSGGAGTVQGGALELSTTDLATEFVNLILAENAYSASLKAFQTGEDMSRELLNVKA